MEAIKEELSNVPVDPTNGFIQGQVLRLLQEHREDLEDELEAVTTAKAEEERRVCQLRVCSAQADGSGGEEQLQTVTVPLHKVRMEKEKWYDSMLAEYKSLTAETKAIRPVKRSEIDPEAELVPGKLVCVIKAGGRYKCRAVICGNLASPEADPMPSSLLYASGADGVLIRCALRKAAHHQWDVATTDIKTAFLLAPRPVEQSAKAVAVVPPRIMTDFGIPQPDEVWLVDKALYGFQSIVLPTGRCTATQQCGGSHGREMQARGRCRRSTSWNKHRREICGESCVKVVTPQEKKYVLTDIGKWVWWSSMWTILWFLLNLTPNAAS